MMKKLSEFQIGNVCRDYLNDQNINVLAVKYGVGKSSIHRYLQQQSIPRRDKVSCNRTYHHNERVFDVITNSSAYWIGYLMADGCIYYPPNRSKQISLSSIDKDSVEKFREFLGADNKIKVTNHCRGSETYSLTISSNCLADKLEQYGVTPRKSHTARVCRELEMNRHFWRGVVDGDGSVMERIFHDRKTQKYPTIQLCGSKEMCIQFLNFVKGVYPLCRASVLKTGSIYRVATTGSSARKVISYLYSDCDVYMDRKYSRAQKILGRSL